MSEISELMERDPLKLTREDVSAIAKHYRDNFERYALGLKAPRAAKTPVSKEASATISLEDLGL